MQGAACQDGIELAVENINKPGGITGKAVEVIYEDTGFINTNMDYKTAHNFIFIAFFESKTS